MAARGRPPMPIELRRLGGRTIGTDSGGRRLPPEPSSVAALPRASTPPEPPGHLGPDGLQFWFRAWSVAVTWLSPTSDSDAVEMAATLADSGSIDRSRYRATHEPKDGRVLLALEKQFGAALSSLGFTPVARTRMGVGEVVASPKIDAL